MWLVSSRRQGMLTQGPASDPKCGLNITSFLTLPHRLHFPICAKDIMVTVLLLQVMRKWEGWKVVHLLGFVGKGGGDRGWVLCFFYVLFCFCAVVGVLSWLLHDSLLCLFHCSFSASFSLVPSVRR